MKSSLLVGCQEMKLEEIRVPDVGAEGVVPLGLTHLRSGNNTVENVECVPTGSLIVEKEIGSIQGLKYDEGVRVVETRSRSKQEEVKQSNSAGGKPGRNTSSSTVLLDRTILSSYSDLDLAKCQKSDPDIELIYESLLSGRKRPPGVEVAVKSWAARHYWVIWNSLTIKEGMIYKESLQKNGLSKFYQLLVPRKLKNEVLK